jgi:hypothetical protein
MIENEGELDRRLIELLGGTTKENSDKIGMHGSGIKYAIAECLRDNIGVSICIGESLLTFDIIQENIRDTVFDRIVIKENGHDVVKTGLTTKFGHHDWKDPWFIIREFICNAMDESGNWIGKTVDSISGVNGKTRVFIEMTPAIKEIVHHLSSYIKQEEPLHLATPFGSVYQKTGLKCRVFRKNIFVKEMEYSSVYDYNLDMININEARTAGEWDIRYEVGRVFFNLPLVARVSILQEIAKHGDKCFEGGINYFPSMDDCRKQALLQAFQAAFPENVVVSMGIVYYLQELTSRGYLPVTFPTPWDKELREAGCRCDSDILGIKGKSGTVKAELDTYSAKILQTAKDNLINVFSGKILNTPIDVFADIDSDTIKGVEGFAIKVGHYQDDWKIGIRETVIQKGVRETMEVLIEEFTHVETGHEDRTREYEQVLCRKAAEWILKAKGIVV